MSAITSTVGSFLPERTLLHLRALDNYLYGENEIRLLPQLCAVGREAIDAGANIGIYTYFLRKYATRVHAYEPNPTLATRLRRQFPDVNVRGVALSDAPNQVILKIPISAKGRIAHEQASISQDFSEAVEEYLVDAVTVDSEMLMNVGFIKVDVEQHERQVLRGALKTIRNCRPVIMTEVCPLTYEAIVPVVFAFILNEGYVGWFKFNRTWRRLTEFQNEFHANSKNFCNRDAFIGTNLLFFPTEHDLAKSGPKNQLHDIRRSRP